MSHKNLIKKLGFLPQENTNGIFFKKYTNDYNIYVDLENELINYGDLILCESATTQNFSQSENWVVLECVDRLLEKGYQPKNITLEKTWATGHGTSGRLDILITRDDGTAYLMIECKTYGSEFDKEFKQLKKDGGQLFTYFQQDKNADILMLYASELNGDKVIYRNEIIKIEEEYRQTGNVKDFYDVWNKLSKNNGIFDSWVKPYNFQSKALTPKNLTDIKQEDSEFIFHRFLEILRHNVVSDKPNAFNKIFTIFLCKIYDEKATRINEELAFQWFYTPYQYQGFNYPPDDNISFQKRLTDLYKKGMKEFLDKEVTDISDADFENKYKSLHPDTKRQILNEFTEIRLKKNNEFAIKEVFNDDSFTENAKVVKEVVELLQGYKIRYTKKQQYLSDFFESLLTTGLKQESGQFFTPVPIAQFIIKSLPLHEIVIEKLTIGEKDNLLPNIIDYAAGSGHFITESMHEVQRIIDKINPHDFIESTSKKLSTWHLDHFDWAYQYVYGIEKDYRLVKVGKVGCYLHGDGLAQIIHSDGLGNFIKTEDYKALLKKNDKEFPKDNKQFDIVISNPPYSIEAFRQNSRKYYTENDFDIYNKLTDKSSEIECLFIERTKQLLKYGGVVGIILPTSILDSSGINADAREIILKYFEIIAITELGTNTFMATKIKTVVLFLRRRNNYTCINIAESVLSVFKNYRDNTINGIEYPISKYVSHVWEGISYADYVTFLQKEPNATILENEIYLEYWQKINAKTEQEKWNKIIELEQSKITYFILTYPQRIVWLKTGEKSEEKSFLGYEFSERRGKEGIHPIIKGKNIEDCTKLFDANRFDNPEKASTYIYEAFKGNFDLSIDKGLEKNIEYLNLIDLLDFADVEFDKKIKKRSEININYEEIWGTDKLESLQIIADVKKGTSITKAQTIEGEIPVIAGGQTQSCYHNQFNREGDTITVSASGAYAGFINFFSIPIFASDCNTIKSKNEETIKTKLIFYYIKVLQQQFYKLQRGQAQPHVYGDDINKVKIPLPDSKTQKKIISEIEALEKKSLTIVIPNIDSEREKILKKYL